MLYPCIALMFECQLVIVESKIEWRQMNQAPDRNVLRKLVSALRERHYLHTARFPSLQRPFFMLPFEPNVMLSFTRNKTSPFTPSALPSLYRFRWFAKHPDTALLYRFFFLNQPASLQHLSKTLGTELIGQLVDAGIVRKSDGHAKANFRMVPYGDTIFLSDPDQGDVRTTIQYVYVGGDSVTLSNFVSTRMLHRSYGRGLDLCAGTAFQGHNIKPHCDSVIAAEFNPRAVDFARAILYANSVPDTFSVIQSDLWENVTGSFDIIVSNPPYYPVPENKWNPMIMDVFGGDDHGMEKPLIIFDGFGQFLNPSGEGMLLAASPIIKDEDVLLSRLKPLAEKHGLETVLVPWKYTNMRLDPEYQVENGIDYLIHYIVHARLTGNGSVISTGYPFPVRTLQKLQLGFQKMLPSWPRRRL